MKKNIAILGMAIVAFTFVSCSSTNKTNNSSAKTNNTNQVLPISSNPIINSSTTPGLEIIKANAEDNVDPVSNKAINDRLQITIKNSGKTSMKDVEIYYEMKDTKTSKIESYSQKLIGLVLAPGETKTIYFDNETGSLHYPENKYSLYRTSTNEVDFTIQISTPGYKIATITAKKSVGTGEVPGA